jgi:catechol 2,3-dioxygenase-like lactoylglutathione lyase family enzyme
LGHSRTNELAMSRRKEQPTVAALITALVKKHGGESQLSAALRRADPSVPRVPATKVRNWMRRTLPDEASAKAIAVLLDSGAATFWKAYVAETQGIKKRTELPSATPQADLNSISVLGVVWVGSRTDDLNAQCAFYSDVLRLHLVHRCKQDHAIFRTVSGDYVALYGPSTAHYKLFNSGPVVGFRVGDIIAARAQMEESGIKFIGPTRSRETGRWKYAHYRGLDGNLYEIIEEHIWSDFE